MLHTVPDGFLGWHDPTAAAKVLSHSNRFEWVAEVRGGKEASFTNPISHRRVSLKPLNGAMLELVYKAVKLL